MDIDLDDDDKYCEDCTSGRLYTGNEIVIREPFDPTHLNCRDYQRGYTLLHIAIDQNDDNLFLLLLSQYHIDVNVSDSNYKTPLHLAIEKTRYPCAYALIRFGCDIHKKDRSGCTPFMYAVRDAIVDLAHELLKSGANINEQNKFGYTALHFSCWDLEVEMLDLLIYYGADPRIRNNKNETFFMTLLKLNRPVHVEEEDSSSDEVVLSQKYIIDFEDDMNIINTEGYSTLFLAIRSESVLLEEIIRRGADVNYYNINMNAISLALNTKDCTAFDLIWPRFNYYHVYGHYNAKPILCNFLSSLLKIGWLHCLNRLFSSNVMRHAVQHYFNCSTVQPNLNPLISMLMEVYFRRRFYDSLLFPYINTLVFYGADVFLDDIEKVYIFCEGRHEIVRLLLNMDIKMNFTFYYISYPYVMLNVISDVTLIFNSYTVPSDIPSIAKQLKFLPILFKYCTPTIQFLEKLRIMQYNIELADDNSNNINLKEYLIMTYKLLTKIIEEQMSLVPSLLELCRNFLRRFICSQNKIFEYKVYRRLLHENNMPKRFSSILLFRAPVNDITIFLPDVDKMKYKFFYANGLL